MNRSKLTWLACVVVALGAQGTAWADGPAAQPSAATHSASGAASPSKKGTADATVDWNRLAARHAAAASASSAALPLPGAGGPISSSATGGENLQGVHSASLAAPTNAGQAARIVPDAPTAGAPSTSAATPDSVVSSQIQPAAATCYENDPDSKSRRPGRLVLLMKLSASGTVDSVSVGINAGVSPSLVGCITGAARAAKFAAGAGGSMVPAMFTFPLRPQGK